MYPYATAVRSPGPPFLLRSFLMGKENYVFTLSRAERSSAVAFRLLAAIFLLTAHISRYPNFPPPPLDFLSFLKDTNLVCTFLVLSNVNEDTVLLLKSVTSATWVVELEYMRFAFFSLPSIFVSKGCGPFSLSCIKA